MGFEGAVKEENDKILVASPMQANAKQLSMFSQKLLLHPDLV
jgi:hypothetical protein